MPKLSQLPKAPAPLQSGDTIIGVKKLDDSTFVDFQYEYSQIPVGAQGPSGPVGAQGQQGPQGLQGPQGIKGDKGDRGETGATGISGLNWKGTWVSGTSYYLNDAVAYSGASYFCISATSGTTAPNADTSHWTLLAAQGATGATGPQGNTGLQGAQGIQGVTGLTGATGPQGPQGATGATGATGPQGVQGIQGVAGTNAAPHSILTVYGNGSRITGLSVDAGYQAGSGYAVNDTFYIRKTPAASIVATGKVTAVATAGNNSGFANCQSDGGVIFQADPAPFSPGATYVAGINYRTAVISGHGTGCIVQVTSVDSLGAITGLYVIDGGIDYQDGGGNTLRVLSTTVPTTITVLNAGAGYIVGNNYTAENIIGTGSGLIPRVTSISATNGPVITNAFFSNTIIQITFGTAVYMVNQEFTQTGTTITASNPALLFSQYGSQIIAWS